MHYRSVGRRDAAWSASRSGATSAIRPAISLACALDAAPGDVDGLLALDDVFHRSPAGSRQPLFATQPCILSTRTGSAYDPAFHMARAVAVLGDARGHGDVPQPRDAYRARVSGRAAAARRVRRASASLAGGLEFVYRTFVSIDNRRVPDGYPPPGPFLNCAAILLLRNVYLLYLRDDRVSDLAAHLRAWADRQADDHAAAFTARLALCAVLWWDNHKDEALAALEQAVARGGGR